MNCKRKVISYLLSFSLILTTTTIVVSATLKSDNQAILTVSSHQKVINQEVSTLQVITNSYRDIYGVAFGTAIINSINNQQKASQADVTLDSIVNSADLKLVTKLDVDSDSIIDLTTDILKDLINLDTLTISGNVTDIEGQKIKTDVFLASNKKLTTLSITSTNGDDIKIDPSFLITNTNLQTLTLNLDSTSFEYAPPSPAVSYPESFLDKPFQNLTSLTLNVTNLDEFLRPPGYNSAPTLVIGTNINQISEADFNAILTNPASLAAVIQELKTKKYVDFTNEENITTLTYKAKTHILTATYNETKSQSSYVKNVNLLMSGFKTPTPPPPTTDTVNWLFPSTKDKMQLPDYSGFTDSYILNNWVHIDTKYPFTTGDPSVSTVTDDKKGTIIVTINFKVNVIFEGKSTHSIETTFKGFETSTTPVPYAFDDMAKLTSLTLSTKNFDTMYDPANATKESLNIFQKLDTLTNLTISTENEMKIAQDAFSSLDKLTNIKLDGNLKSLPDDCFVDNVTLTTIDLSNNNFNNIPKAVNIASLENLSMQTNNSLLEVDFNNFSKAKNLTTLTLDKLVNGIKFDNSWTYSNNPKPITLLLDNDLILKVPQVILNANNIVNLDLSHNEINIANNIMFANDSALQTLDLSYNYISITDEVKLLKNTKKLTDINLSNNYLVGTIPDLLFINNVDLKNVNLANNHIADIDANAFQNNINIVNLDLSNNVIKEVSPRQFDHLKELKTLNMSFNQLPNLPDDVFNNNHKLVSLKLNNNKLKSLPIDSINHLSDNLVIDVSNNFLGGKLGDYQLNPKQNWNFSGNKDNSDASNRYTHITIIVLSILVSLLVVALVCVSLWRIAKKRERLAKKNETVVDSDEGY